jgi:TrmH family RNA methyltransferase
MTPAQAFLAHPPATLSRGLAERLERDAPDCEIVPVDREILAWAASVKSEVECVALFSIDRYTALHSGRRVRWALILENVGDPGNVGAAIRSAAAAGVDEVSLTGSCADWANPKTVRSSAGLLFALPVRTDASVDVALRRLGLEGWGTVPQGGEPLFDLSPPASVAIVLGNEVGGLSAEARESCVRLITIPMARGIDSLNVGAAAAVCAFHLCRGG